jgi:hypothetical protein
MEKHAYDMGINWIWYLKYTQAEDGSVTILDHFRCHKGDGGHPDANDRYRLTEDAKRIVTHVSINGEVYPVSNPAYVFSYGKG